MPRYLWHRRVITTILEVEHACAHPSARQAQLGHTVGLPYPTVRTLDHAPNLRAGVALFTMPKPQKASQPKYPLAQICKLVGSCSGYTRWWGVGGGPQPLRCSSQMKVGSSIKTARAPRLYEPPHKISPNMTRPPNLM